MTMNDFVITPPYDVLLRGTTDISVGLYHLQIATAEQLTRLHYSPNSVKAVKAKLKILTEHGFTQVDSIPVRQLRSPYFYTLGSRGLQYLHQAGFDTNESWRAVKEVGKHALFIEHTLEINDVLISAALLHTVSDDYRLDHFTHERVLKRMPYKPSYQTEHGMQSVTIIPDAFLDFRHGEKRLAVLLEHDRGTEEQFRFRQKIRGYIVLLKSEAHKQLFGTKTITIVFTTFNGQHRLEQLRHWTREELANEPGALWSAFCFANLARPLDPKLWLEPTWFSPFDNRPPEILLAV